MARTKINVYLKMNKIEKNEEFFAIKNNDVIKYIDFENNIMTIDMDNNVIIRENNDYKFILDFNKNNINITIKKIKKTLDKSINTLLLEKTKKRFIVRYLLNDEKEINEYYVNF